MYILYLFVSVCVWAHTYILHYFPLIATRPCYHCRLLNTVMQKTQGRRGQDEEAELLAGEIGCFTARSVVSDAAHSQWIS